MRQGAFVCGALALGLSTAFGAVYDATTGYVTIPANSYPDSSGYNGSIDFLFGSAGVNKHWSDGDKPHASTNYYVNTCLCSYYIRFEGARLVLGPSGYLRPANDVPSQWTGEKLTSCQIDDLYALGGAAFNGQFGHSVKFTGQLTLDDSTATTPFTIIGGRNGQSTEIAMRIVGGASTVMRSTGYKYWNQDGSTQHTGGPMNTVLSGDNSAFYGTVEVLSNMNLTVKTALPHAAVVFDSPGSTFAAVPATDGDTLRLGKLRMTSGNLKLCLTGCLAADEFSSAEDTVIDGSDLYGAKPSVKSLLVVGKKWNPQGRVSIDLSSTPLTIGRDPVDILVVSNAAGTVDTSLIDVAFDPAAATCQWVSDADATALRLTGFREAAYDATTGYVVLTNGESKVMQKAWDTVSLWSDGQVPHATTNYFMGRNAIQFKASTFQGKSLTSGDPTGTYEAWPRVDAMNNWSPSKPGNICRIDEFHIISSLGFEMCGSHGVRVFAGDWRLEMPGGKYLCIDQTYYTGADDSTRVGGKDDKTESIFYFYCDFHGVSSMTIYGGNPDSRYNHVYVPGTLKPEVHLLGDMSDYRGAYRMLLNSQLYLGDTGLPGALYADRSNTCVRTEAAAGRTVAVGSFTASYPSAIEVPATNALSVGSLNLTGALAKSGAGTLALGGTAVAGTDAAIDVTAGALKPLSKACVGTIPVAFADGTGVALDWSPASADVAAYGLYLGDAASVAFAGETLNVSFDLGAETPARCPYRKNLLTVKDADAAKFAGKIRVARPFRGVRVATVGSTSANGLTTFYADIALSGLAVILR